MRSMEDQLTQYATYHRHRYNIATHFVGIPLIVLALTTLLARPTIVLSGLVLSPATLVALIVGLYYLRLDLRLGLLMNLLLMGSVAAGQWIAALPTALWLTTGIALFVIGWIFQLIGHVFEGRKPAFIDDLVGLLIGPLFIVVELLALMGAMRALTSRINHRAGPLRGGRSHERAAS
jgi:uncharacterized membrane protein YGL010W